MTDYSYWITVDNVEVEPPKAKAYLIVIDEKKEWIPESTVHDVEVDEHTGEITALKVEMWMIRKKGLEAYIEENEFYIKGT